MKPDVSLIPAPDRAPDVRRPLTRRETIELAVRQDGKCGCGCGLKLNALTEGVTDEHVIPLEQLGTNDLENRSLYRTPCALEKTKVDAGNTASCKRIEARETGTRRARKPIPKHVAPWPEPGTIKIPTKRKSTPSRTGERG